MASSYLTRSFSAGNRKTFTQSFWVKLGVIGANPLGVSCKTADNTAYNLYLDSNSVIDWYVQYTNPSWTGRLITNRKFRDPNAWYHIVAVVDTTQATESDRLKLYVNGVQETSFSTAAYPTQNSDVPHNDSANSHYVGAARDTGGYMSGVYAHFHFCDGYAYTPSDFGETDATTGVWKPIVNPSVSYGTNGFFLKFENSGAIGTDSSGNGNDFSVGAGSVTQTQDTPSNVFATLNPLIKYPSGMTFSNGNLTLTCSGSQWQGSASTLAVNKGKWYFEAKYNTGTGIRLDIGRADADLVHMGNVNNSYLAYRATGFGYQLNNTGYDYYVTAGSATTWTTDRGNSTKILMVAVDLDNGKYWVGDNGTWYNTSGTANPATGTDPRHSFSGSLNGEYWFFGMSIEGTGSSHNLNFGNGYFGTTAVTSGVADGAGLGIFEYTPPAGYYALCTKNINTYG